MRIKQAIPVLKSALARNRPIILTSGPGVGKTAIVEMITEMMEYELLVTYPVYWDITDPKGLPMPVTGADYAEFLPFGEVQKVLTATKPTVWFFDDFTQAAEEVQAALMPLFLKREIGGRKIPDCVQLVLAGNGLEHSSAVVPMLDALKGRLAAFVNVVPHIEDWTYWAMGKGAMSPEVIGFLRFKPDYLYVYKHTSKLQGFAAPRSWEEVNRWYVEQKGEYKLDDATFAEVIGSLVEDGIAGEFLAYLKMFKALSSIEKAFINPEKVELPSQPDALYAFCTALAHRVNVSNIPALIKLANRLHKEQKGDMASLLVNSAGRKKPEVKQTEAYIGYLATHGEFQVV